MAQGGSARMADFLNIPVSIVLGILLGAIAGYCIYHLFEKSYQHHFMIRNSTKVIILLGVSFLLMSVETLVKPYVAVSGLLAVVAAACIIKLKSVNSVSARLSEKFGKLWIGAEVMLFVLVGAAVDVRYTLSAGGAAVLMIFIALIFRAVGVFLCLLGTDLNAKERLFCIIAYLPKATVQAAIGSVPLSLGLPCGKIVLSVAVLAILITAPLGAIGIDKTYRGLLDH
jgi:NhaP-type Na+/H+ or K+/H+ antiporter